MAPLLLPPREALRPRLGVPGRFYQILNAPAPLAGSEFPSGYRDWPRLIELGFRHVVCLEAARPSYDPSPLLLLHACELDDLSVTEFPDDPAFEARRIRAVARKIVTALNAGEGVLVHCAAGRGRTGTVLGATLKMLGLPATTIVGYLDQLHRERSGKGWPESPWQSRLVKATRPQRISPRSRNEK